MASDHITDAMVEAALIAWINSHGPTPRDDMRAALLAAERAAWQPIETAPRDGTKVLTWHPFHKYAVTWWDDGTWRDEADSWEPGMSPTYWRPLPPAPEADNG